MTVDGTPKACAQPDCDRAVTARVSTPAGPFGNAVFAIVRPLSSPLNLGVAMCLDHAHNAVDLVLMANLPAPTTAPEATA